MEFLQNNFMDGYPPVSFFLPMLYFIFAKGSICFQGGLLRLHSWG